MLVVGEFLTKNSYDISGRHLESACLRVALGDFKLKGVYRWLERRAARLEED